MEEEGWQEDVPRGRSSNAGGRKSGLKKPSLARLNITQANNTFNNSDPARNRVNNLNVNANSSASKRKIMSSGAGNNFLSQRNASAVTYPSPRNAYLVRYTQVFDLSSIYHNPTYLLSAESGNTTSQISSSYQRPKLHSTFDSCNEVYKANSILIDQEKSKGSIQDQKICTSLSVATTTRAVTKPIGSSP
jgi:hypothetical protein